MSVMSKEEWVASLQGHGTYGYGDWKLKNPIPELVRDIKDLQKLFDNLPIAVPYASTANFTSQRSLSLLFSLHELSKTQKAVLGRKIEFCFGGFLDFQPKQYKGFRADLGEADLALKIQFIEHIQSLGIDLAKIKQIITGGAQDDGICGTQFVRCTLAQVEGIWKCSLSLIDPRHCVRLFDEKKPNASISNSVLISKGLETGQIELDGFEVVGLYPEITSRGAGVIESVFQMNGPGYETAFYGRSVANILDLLSDYQRSNHKAKVTQTDLVSMVAMFLEMPNQEASGPTEQKSSGFNAARTAAEIREKMQSDGDAPKSVFVQFYPNGTQKPELKEVNINRDHLWAKFVAEDCESGISIAYGIHPGIMGYQKVGGGVGGNILLDLYTQCNEFTVEPMQDRYVEFWDNILGFILTQTGREDLNKLSLKFPDKMTAIIESLKAQNSPNASTTADTQNSQGA